MLLLECPVLIQRKAGIFSNIKKRIEATEKNDSGVRQAGGLRPFVEAVLIHCRLDIAGTHNKGFWLQDGILQLSEAQIH